MKITIKQGNIVQAEVDAIVNAANPKMLGGGGVDGAIHAAAGPKLLEECRKVKAVNGIRCPFGEARITLSGNLPSQYVIHTCGPIYENETDPDAVLTSAYEASLNLALENNCDSIAFPALSCGVYGFPHKDAAIIALEVCSREKYKNLKIYFYLYGNKMLETWQNAYEQTIT